MFNPKSAAAEEDDKDDPFYEHWEIDQVIPNKCIAAVCNKLRQQRFMMRQVPHEVLLLSDFIDTEINGGKKTKVGRMSLENSAFRDDIVKPWMDIKPQIPVQNFVHCYGICRIRDHFYMISDLVQDNELLPSQKAEIQQKMTAEGQSRAEHEAFEISLQQTNGGKKDFELSQNMYQLIGSMNLGNLAAFQQIPREYTKMLLGYIIQISRAFSHCHE